mmetsp:Transcript_10381/g.23744  ORF Transcript_10381/g.23744 Transcript_10381/m.23744 type:complete len:492 (-) Transcript_10381:55-1530(-)
MMPGIKNRTCSAIASRWSWLSETNLSYAMSAPGNRWQPRKREAAERSTAQSGEMNAPRLTRQTLSHSAGLLLSSRRATLTRVELVRFYSDRSHSPYSQHFASKSNDFVEGQIVEVRRGDHWNTAKVLVVTSDRILIEFKDIAPMSHEAPTFGAMPKQEWISKSVTQVRAVGEEHHVWSPKYAMEHYHEVMKYLHRLDDRVRFQGIHVLRWLSGMLIVASGSLYLLREDVRSGLGKEGAEVTSRTIQDKKVQVAAEIVAKEVALELLRSPATIDGAAKFVQEVLAQQTTQDAAGKLIVHLYKDEEMLKYTQEWVSVVVGRLCNEEHTQKSIQHLLGVAFTNLFADQDFQKVAGNFAVDVIAQDQVIQQATSLLTTSVHHILDDPVVIEHTTTLVQKILQDPGIRKETANALWGVLATLVTLGYVTPGKYAVQMPDPSQSSIIKIPSGLDLGPPPRVEQEVGVIKILSGERAAKARVEMEQTSWMDQPPKGKS